MVPTVPQPMVMAFACRPLLARPAAGRFHPAHRCLGRTHREYRRLPLPLGLFLQVAYRGGAGAHGGQAPCAQYSGGKGGGQQVSATGMARQSQGGPPPYRLAAPQIMKRAEHFVSAPSPSCGRRGDAYGAVSHFHSSWWSKCYGGRRPAPTTIKASPMGEALVLRANGQGATPASSSPPR